MVENIPQVILSIVFGGVGGAWLQCIYTRSQRREQVALEAMKHFLAVYSDLAEAKYFLGDANRLENPLNQNKVRKVGDWMNLIAFLNSRNLVNKDMLGRCGVQKEMNAFHTLINNSMSNSNVFSDAWNLWPDLDSFCCKHA